MMQDLARSWRKQSLIRPLDDPPSKIRHLAYGFYNRSKTDFTKSFAERPYGLDSSASQLPNDRDACSCIVLV